MSNANNDQNNLGPTNATSPTTFGQSVESKAQRDDAVTTDDTRERLNVYRLEPLAEANDPRWDNSPYQGIVVVAARTCGDARIVAAERELDFMEIDSAPAEDVTTSNASAFRSEKLYTVIEIDHGRMDLTRSVLEGEISVATIKPVQI
ncbi:MULTISPECIES: hypothetical protein [unclassified Rhizobium]|uniref:hypothetical protein n=1 Tax=unclassified Rhizobium TaxID=2613769 RepID=UPI00071248F3|nr:MULTISPECIES: hypothetical protein [unclassified Rhizobium]KQS85017.1 hypothetical protein ASG50_29385 [Rhizobium sp. Leaf386]KQS95756.1 hypothetical protein ASG42_28980 [Rhizobium sp. Leaf391]KQU05982.1 hypothetical protein ASG68_24830 [Rhizobium sp. Leaf453]